uniref:H/ACA ribonucleoprotein complex subunit n=1 Tax=Magallana gigas TaxID=29159 RepID=K1QAH9_MAGGI
MSRGGFNNSFGRGGGGRGGRGGGFRGGGRGGGRGGFGNRYQDQGPPETVKEVGEYVHPCEDDLVCVSTIEDVPHFNAPIFLENKQQIGKVDEIFGSIRNFYFSVKLSENMKAKSFSKSTKTHTNCYPCRGFYLSRLGLGVGVVEVVEEAVVGEAGEEAEAGAGAGVEAEEAERSWGIQGEVTPLTIYQT